MEGRDVINRQAAAKPAVNVGVVGRNAAFNVVRLGSGFFLVAILPILLRNLSSDEYNIWVLVVQIPRYLNLLGLGISVAIVRLVAAQSEESEFAKDDVVDVGAQFGLWLVGVGIVCVVLAAFAVPMLFQAIPDRFQTVTSVGVVLLGVGSCLGLIGIPFAAYFDGIQDNAGSSLVVVVTRGAGAAVVIAMLPFGLTAMFVALSVSLVLGGVGQWLIYRRRRAPGHIPPDAEMAKELRRDFKSHVSTFAVWSVVGLVSSGLDISIVGAFDFDQVGAYGAAVGIITIFGGLATALMNAFIPEASRQPDSESSGATLTTASSVGGLLAWCSVAGVVAFGEPVLLKAFGPQVGGDAFPILVTLAVAMGIKNLIWPYVIGVLAAGEHHKVRATPIVEGVVNLVVSLVLVLSIGAIGAAIGTLIATIIAMAMHLAINVPRTPQVGFGRMEWLRQGVVRPGLTVLPMMAIPLANRYFGGVLGLGLTMLLTGISCVLISRRFHSIRRATRAQTVAELV